MASAHNRIMAVVLSATFIGQVLLFGDGTAKGILHPKNIAYAIDSIKLKMNSDELVEDFKKK